MLRVKFGEDYIVLEAGVVGVDVVVLYLANVLATRASGDLFPGLTAELG